MVLSIFAPKTTGFFVELDGEPVFMKVEDQEKTLILSVGGHAVEVRDQLVASLGVNMLLDMMRTSTLDTSDTVTNKQVRFSLAEEKSLTFVIRYGAYDEIEFHYDDAFEADADDIVVEAVCSEQQYSEKKANRLNKMILCGILAMAFSALAVCAWLSGSAPIGWQIISPMIAAVLWVLFAVSIHRKDS